MSVQIVYLTWDLSFATKLPVGPPRSRSSSDPSSIHLSMIQRRPLLMNYVLPASEFEAEFQPNCNTNSSFAITL